MSAIRIISCSSPLSNIWYSTEIGKEFQVEREEVDCYWVRENCKYKPLNWVLKRDCIAVKQKEIV